MFKPLFKIDIHNTIVNISINNISYENDALYHFRFIQYILLSTSSNQNDPIIIPSQTLQRYYHMLQSKPTENKQIKSKRRRREE